jgi:hypothetical protein
MLFLESRKSEMGLSLTARATRALILSESSPTTTFSRYLTCGCNSHIRILVLPQVLPACFWYHPLRTCRPVLFGQFQPFPPNALCQHLQPGFLLFPAMSLVLNTDGRP